MIKERKVVVRKNTIGYISPATIRITDGVITHINDWRVRKAKTYGLNGKVLGLLCFIGNDDWVEFAISHFTPRIIERTINATRSL